MPGRPSPTTSTRLPDPGRKSKARHRTFSVAMQRPESRRRTRRSRNAPRFWLGPALLEVVVDRRHHEDALAGALELGDLDDHAQRLDDEHAADDQQRELGLGGHGQHADARRPAPASRRRP